MTQAQQREIALGAVRSQLRRLRVDLTTVSPEEAVLTLDDLYRSEPDLVASHWYAQASGYQIKLFRREWKKQFSQQISPIRTSQAQRPVTLWDLLEQAAERTV